LITQKTVFKWDGKKRGIIAWNRDQTPHSWLKDSVVWVSQTLTPQLGLKKIKIYLRAFHYGNQDFSGDPGQDNGLTQAWLNSSLKISANEQRRFLQALVQQTLPVSKEAMKETKENMFLATSPHGWKWYGKTGTGVAMRPSLPASSRSHRQNGWLIGWIEKGKQQYIVILNFTDLDQPDSSEPAGERAKAMVEALLTEEKLY
jgi:beta-lactamase class D